MKNVSRAPRRVVGRPQGFTLLELVTVIAIMLIAAAFAVPNVATMIHAAKLQGAASDFSGVVQACRLRAIQDDSFYPVYILTSTNQAFVDLYGGGGTSMDPRDPSAMFPSEVTAVAASSAPNTANLFNQFLPTGSTLTVKDAAPAAATPITFGPRGLPCTSQTANGGTVCDSSGGATAFWLFLQDSKTGAYQAVTVSPAGRIRKWFYSGGVWNAR